MNKSPFERVFSLVDRRKLLQSVARNHVTVILKNERNQVYIFKAEKMDKEFNLQGTVPNHSGNSVEKVTALFYIDKERYFLTTKLKMKEGKVCVLLNDTQFFKFNRRNAYRITLDGTVEMSLQILTIRNIDVKKNIRVIEFSSGGARVHWTGNNKLSVGTIIKGVLQWRKGKFVPIDASVVHNLGNGIYGVRFVNLTPSLVNRLKMLSIEVQQTIYLA
jgi:hypothetical protein